MKQSQITQTHALCFSGFVSGALVVAGLKVESSSTFVLVRSSSALSKASFLLMSPQRDGITTPFTTIGELSSLCITVLVFKGAGKDNGVECGAVVFIAEAVEDCRCLLRLYLLLSHDCFLFFSVCFFYNSFCYEPS